MFVNLLEQIDLSAFENKSTLNPSIFDLDIEKMKMDVRKTLLDVANDFFDDLDVNVDYSDIWLVGSNANYNWSEFSDVDVHILVPFSEVGQRKSFLKDYFDTKKTNWNQKHDISIDIYKVELYVQDSEDENAVQSGGIYSILYDSWIRQPQKSDVKIDVKGTEQAINNFVNRFKGAMKYRKNPERFSKELDNLNNLLHSERSAGLKSGGEFSPSNLAFKFLRRKGLKDKIKQLKIRAYDTAKSVSHGTTLGTYLGSKKQRQLSGNKNYVDKLDKLAAYNEKKGKKKDSSYSDGIYYSVHGAMYSSLRAASKATGEKKSTIQYRVHSKNPKYSDYKVIYKK